MDFHQLLAKMQQLDQPVAENLPAEACGDMPPMGMPPKAEEPPPSMSVNLNAQGLDNIEELMKLIMKVNPDMDKPSMPPLPSMGMEPSIAAIKPSLPPLKMLPDFDAKNDDMPGGEKDHMEPDGDEGPEIKGLDRDGDGDHDMKDHDLEKKDKEEAFGNSLGDSEPDMGDMDDIIRSGDDLHKKKNMFKAAAGGDNPMAAESTDLRSQIRAELMRRLNEAKGVK